MWTLLLRCLTRCDHLDADHCYGVLPLPSAEVLLPYLDVIVKFRSHGPLKGGLGEPTEMSYRDPSVEFYSRVGEWEDLQDALTGETVDERLEGDGYAVLAKTPVFRPEYASLPWASATLYVCRGGIGWKSWADALKTGITTGPIREQALFQIQQALLRAQYPSGSELLTVATVLEGLDESQTIEVATSTASTQRMSVRGFTRLIERWPGMTTTMVTLESLPAGQGLDCRLPGGLLLFTIQEKKE